MIVTFDPPENIGGIEGRVEGFLRELPKRGVRVELMALSDRYQPEKSAFMGFPLYKASSRPDRALDSTLYAQAAMTSGRTEALFLLSGGATLVGNLLLLAARFRGQMTAVLFYGKDILEARSRLSGRLLMLGSLLLSKRVLTNSAFTASLLPGYARRKVMMLYPGVDPDFARTLPVTSQDKRVLFVGRLVRRKGVDDLLDAFREVSARVPGAKLDIVGDGPERKRLEGLAADLGISGVTFHGSQRGDSLATLYAACSFVVLPSKSTSVDVEGFGTVFLEAGVFSKPSVGTLSGGIPEAVLHRKTGLLVRESDVPGLAAAMVTLLTDESLRSTMGNNARERVLLGFTWKDSADRLMAALQRGPNSAARWA